jgi:hypothetical protein
VSEDLQALASVRLVKESQSVLATQSGCMRRRRQKSLLPVSNQALLSTHHTDKEWRVEVCVVCRDGD